MTDRITDDELAYHARVAAEMKAAQAAWSSWAAHLAAKYQLGPQDRIAEDGMIERATSPSGD